MTVALKRGVPLAFLVAACIADVPAGRQLTEAELRSANVCEFRNAGSRWAPSGTRYTMAGEFGRRDEEALIDVWGIAASPGGEVFVYDAGSTRILKLGSDLEWVETFGRSGQGPGELTYQRAPHGDWIAAEDSSIFVLDLRVLLEFDLNGEFRRYPTRKIPFPLPIERIAVHDGEIVYVADDINRRNGTRSLQTWRMEPSAPHTLLRTDSMPPLPQADHGRFVQGLFVSQADPLWAMHGRCAFISDGAGDWILRVDLIEKRADTLHLPSRKILELTESDEEWLERWRRVGTRSGVGSGLDRVQPTARLKWADLIVDPDGFVWLGLWRPRSMRDKPLTTWVVHPATGVVDSVVVERFPDAFLPGGGAFVSLAHDRKEGHTLVRKYTLESVAK